MFYFITHSATAFKEKTHNLLVYKHQEKLRKLQQFDSSLLFAQLTIFFYTHYDTRELFFSTQKL
jgi:hypothetical protein